MNYSFALPLSTLRAALTHTADQDVRYYLNGILLDLPRGRIVATDGHRMLVSDGPCVHGAPSVIIGSDSIKAVIKAYESAGSHFKQGASLGACDIECTLDQTDARPDPTRPGVTIAASVVGVTFKVPNGNISAQPIDGKFPDYLRVIPVIITGLAGHYQPDYVQDAAAAFRMHRNKKKSDDKYCPALMQNGTSAAVMVDGDNDLLIIIMPRRTDVLPAVAEEACAWARSDAPAQAAAKAAEAAAVKAAEAA